jgi:hypothetical protein
MDNLMLVLLLHDGYYKSRILDQGCRFFLPTVVSHLLKASLNNVGMRLVRNESCVG